MLSPQQSLGFWEIKNKQGMQGQHAAWEYPHMQQ